MKELMEGEVGSFWGWGSPSTWTGGYRERIPSVYDSASIDGFVPGSEVEQLIYTSLENNRDRVPYVKRYSASDFPIEECGTVSFNCLGNMEDFHLSNLNGPFLLEELHTPLLEWNFNRYEVDSLTICPHEDVINHQTQPLNFWDSDRGWNIVKGLGVARLPTLHINEPSSQAKLHMDTAEDPSREDVINDHSQSLDFWDGDHHWSIGEGLETNGLAALPLNFGSSTGTHFNKGIKKDLVATFCHMPITVSGFPGQFHLPGECIHVYSAEVLSYQRPADESFTERQLQISMEDSTHQSDFMSESGSGLQLLLPQDPSFEANLFLEQPFQPPQEEQFSSWLARNDDWEDFMGGSFQDDSSDGFNQNIDRWYVYFHSYFQKEAFYHMC
ncbi:hypothetical protein SAY86_021599 [Trapa natans]|uniref:Uncharacterized protein n=1 Tax=Trapa natans TaxID=22666 RepID=A0AAN7MKQ1_TRANT|nr:hypothetical protein SAY86_021599 [Trapa natans]